MSQTPPLFYHSYCSFLIWHCCLISNWPAPRSTDSAYNGADRDWIGSLDGGQEDQRIGFFWRYRTYIFVTLGDILFGKAPFDGDERHCPAMACLCCLFFTCLALPAMQSYTEQVFCMLIRIINIVFKSNQVDVKINTCLFIHGCKVKINKPCDTH